MRSFWFTAKKNHSQVIPASNFCILHEPKAGSRNGLERRPLPQLPGLIPSHPGINTSSPSSLSFSLLPFPPSGIYLSVPCFDTNKMKVEKALISMIIIITGCSRNSTVAKQPARASQNHFTETQRQIDMLLLPLLCYSTLGV